MRGLAAIIHGLPLVAKVFKVLRSSDSDVERSRTIAKSGCACRIDVSKLLRNALKSDRLHQALIGIFPCGEAWGIVGKPLAIGDDQPDALIAQGLLLSNINS